MRNFLFNLWENLIYVLVGILAVNIIILDITTFITKPKPIVQNISVGGNSQTETTSTSSGQTVQSEPSQQTATSNNSCPTTCLAAIQTATASLKLTQNVVNNTTTTQQVQGTANEYFVPFGSATAASQGSYTTVGGLQSYVNMNQYTGVQSVVFEVSLSSSGIAQVQLYDATDGYAIPNSQVSTPGGNPQLLISSPLTLPSANKLYQVQINTQLTNPATINQARLHITTN